MRAAQAAIRTPRLIEELARALDARVVGQSEAKLGLLLGLLARRHVYLEGPPGCGKSLLAATLLAAVDVRSATFAFHRDVRAEDLLGDALLKRTTVDLGRDATRDRLRAAERIRVEIAPGPLLEAEVLLLEDISRAPGEALGVLLRILAERRALGRVLPLETAIATAPTESPDGHADPLEPTQLDRFAIQVRMQGLLAQRCWQDAAKLLDRSATVARQRADRPEGLVDRETRLELQRRARAVSIAPAVRRAYQSLLEDLALGCDPKERDMLSDRAFAVDAPALFRAHALLRGASKVSTEDFVVLRLMTARRWSEALRKRVEELIESADDESANDIQMPTVGTGSAAEGIRAVVLESSGESQAPRPAHGSARLEGVPEDAEPDPEMLVARVDPLMKALTGRIERGWVDPESDPGGQPRSYRPLRRLDELYDADLVDALLLIEGRTVSARTFRRKRRAAGGALVILRDISASMAGAKSAWAARIVRAVTRASARQRIRVGYVEFDHRARGYPVAGRFLHRSYAMLASLAESQRAIGQTNYEAPLRLALNELKGRTGRNRHIVMLTDGLPILGDPKVRRERRQALRLGVHLHTVFLGEGPCPHVLDELSIETSGLRFRAMLGGSGGVNDLRLVERS